MRLKIQLNRKAMPLFIYFREPSCQACNEFAFNLFNTPLGRPLGHNQIKFKRYYFLQGWGK